MPTSPAFASSPSLHASIERLQHEQQQLTASKSHIQKAMRNAERKGQRLRERAWQLTDEEPLSVMLMRSEKKKGMAAAAAAAGAPESNKAATDALVHGPGA